tara:strand:- start:343 stop:501 length:159 start_codon:yes stop_codon:yes gene_type:complete
MFDLEADEPFVPSLQATQAIQPKTQKLVKGLRVEEGVAGEQRRLIYIERVNS